MKIRHWMCLATITAALPFVSLACSSKANEEVVTPPKASENEKLVAYKVTGMTCSGCEAHIRTELAKLPNVTKAVASHKEQKAWIVVKGEEPSRDEVEKAIKAAGDNYKLGDKS